MYSVFDYYESYFGERLYISNELSDAKEFAEMFIEDTDGECILQIRDNNNNVVESY